VSLSAANLITLTRSSTITDADGDSDTDSAVIDIGTALSFDDDGPSIDITAGSTTVIEGQTINNGAWTSDPGADGGVVKVRFNGTDYDLDQAIDTGKGTLTVNANGTWTFAAANNLDQDVAQNVSFDLRMTDADGDFASDSHTISITDGAGPAASAPQSMVVEEAALSDGTNPSSPNEVDTALLTFTSGSDAITSITFGSTAGINVAGLDESQTITWAVSNGGRTLTGSINGDAVIRVELSGASTVAAGGAAGNVTATATLLNNMLHQNNPDADSLTITGVQVVAADPDGSTATFTFTGITVNDDAPTVAAPSGTIENDVGESLAGLVDYDMNADGLGTVTLNAPTVTSGGQAHTLKSNGHTIVYQITDDGDDGLQELKAYADNDNNGFDEGDTLVFTLAPTAPGASDGSYTLTMNDVVDLPVPIISLAFTNIFSPNQIDDRVAIQDSADGPSSLLISAVSSGDKVTDSASFVGIHNNVMDGGETIRYEFGTVDLTSGDATFMTVTEKKLVNDVQLFSFDTGGSPDSFSWVAYRDGSEVGSGSVSPTTLPQGNSGALFPAIHVDGGYDTVVFTVSQGSEFKVGGVTYTELGAPEDVNLNVAFGGSDADGDTIGGSFNVTITGGDGTAESNIIQTLLNNNQTV
jgi:VCBS repeat-containing protein